MLRVTLTRENKNITGWLNVMRNSTFYKHVCDGSMLPLRYMEVKVFVLLWVKPTQGHYGCS